MSLDSNLYEKSIKILTDLISFKTISGKDNGPLIDYCDDILKKNGVSTFRVFDGNKERVKTINFIWTYRCCSSFKGMVYRSICSNYKR